MTCEIPPNRDGPGSDAHAAFVLAEAFADIAKERGEAALERLKSLTICDMDTLVFRMSTALIVIGAEAGYDTDNLTEVLRVLAAQEAARLIDEEFPDHV